MLFGSRFEILPPHVGGAEACTLALVYPRVNCAQFSGKHCVRMEEWELMSCGGVWQPHPGMFHNRKCYGEGQDIDRLVLCSVQSSQVMERACQQMDVRKMQRIQNFI